MSICFLKVFTKGRFRSSWTDKGMGISWGIGGLRVGYGAGGGFYCSVCIPGTGISWRKHFGRIDGERRKS